MLRIAATIAFAASVAACDMVSTMTDGFKTARAVESELEQSTGVRPQVGFNWQNGRLRSVTVIFPGLYETKPLRDVAGLTRAAVTKQFKQTPENIVLGFALAKPDPGTVAQAETTAQHQRAAIAH
ncbi:MAG TPA: hypothetical protein VFB68_11415 [Xanthobacteraceae bacterium]|nr:hypothetical protein [Xanthobacteraceae bacterium]